jgi:Ca2+-transporting ATPase
VAREAAGLVLTDDNFSSIISSIRMGRRIYDNIQKAMGYIFAVHFPIAGLTIIPVLFPSLPLILYPLHIAFMELIIDPASSLIFEAEEEEKDIMKRPPRKASQPAFGVKKILFSSLQGFFVMLVCLAVFFIALKLNRPTDEIRALTFTTLIFANLGLIFINRSWTRTVAETFKEKNNAVRWVAGGAIAFLLLVLYVPGLRQLFHFDTLHFTDLLICLGAGILSILWFEGLKIFRRKYHFT